MATKKTLTTTSGLDPNIELVGGNGGVEPPATYAVDDTSRTIRTIAGNAYCLTLETGNVQISGSDGPETTPDATIIFNADKQGQYVFIAISSWTHINIDLNTKYVINPLNFKVASLGASSGGGGDSFDPSASQTITGAWVYQSTLQRKTVARPALTDVMNSEMVNTALNSTVKLIGNQSIAGTKTFTGGITMGNEKPLVIGSGDNALKLHGEGANGAYVIEGGNSTHLDVAVTSQFQEDVTCASSLIISPGHILQFGTDSYSVGVMANDDATATVGGGPDSVLRFLVSVEINAPSTFKGTANFLAGATRTTKATPADTDLMNKAMCDAAYAPISSLQLTDSSDFLQYVKARGFSNSSSTPSFIVSDLPKPSNMKIKLNPRRYTYNEEAKIQIPQNIVQYLQIVVDQGDGTVKYEEPTLVGTNLEITPKKGMSIEMTCLCSAGTATVCTCVGFNDYDVIGDAYFLSAIV